MDAQEVDATDHVGRESREERLEDGGEGRDVRREQDAAAAGAREIGGSVQADDRLAGAGAGGAADSRGTVEAAADGLVAGCATSSAVAALVHEAGTGTTGRIGALVSADGNTVRRCRDLGELG